MNQALIALLLFAMTNSVCHGKQAGSSTIVHLTDVPIRVAVDLVLSQSSIDYVLCDEIAGSAARTSIRSQIRTPEDAIKWLKSAGLSVIGNKPARICGVPSQTVVYRPKFVPVSYLRATMASIPQAQSSESGYSEKGTTDNSALVMSCRGDECDRLRSTLASLDQPIKRARLRLDLYQIVLSDEEAKELTTADIAAGLTNAGAVVTFRGIALTLQELSSKSSRVFSQLVDLSDAMSYVSRFGSDVSYQDTSVSDGILTSTTKFLQTGTELKLLPRFLDDGVHLHASLSDSSPSLGSGTIVVSSSSATTDVVMTPGESRTILQVQDAGDGSSRRSVFGIPFGKSARRSSSTLVLIGTLMP